MPFQDSRRAFVSCLYFASESNFLPEYGPLRSTLGHWLEFDMIDSAPGGRMAQTPNLVFDRREVAGH